MMNITSGAGTGLTSGTDTFTMKNFSKNYISKYK
jgi:hypothetical protein